MQVDTLADITASDGAAHAFSATPLFVKWFQVNLISSTSGIRVGRITNISASRGVPIATAAGQFFPQDSDDLTSRYDLSLYGYVGTTADKISVTYGI